MGRRIRTPIPQTNKLLVPNWAYLKTFLEKNEHFKQSKKRNFDKQHQARKLTLFQMTQRFGIHQRDNPFREK